jgi:hypothetical protein
MNNPQLNVAGAPTLVAGPQGAGPLVVGRQLHRAAALPPAARFVDSAGFTWEHPDVERLRVWAHRREQRLLTDR